MTANQIAFWQLQRQKAYDTRYLSESERHNQATEAVAQGELAEKERSNRANESLGWGNLKVNQQNAKTNAFNAQVNAKNAETNAKNAETNRLNWQVNKQNANTNAYNAAINARNASTNARNAETSYQNMLVNRENAASNRTYAQIAAKTYNNYTSEALAYDLAMKKMDYGRKKIDYETYPLTRGIDYGLATLGALSKFIPSTTYKYSGKIPESNQYLQYQFAE